MAIITLASPISGIRGTVAGFTYSANKAGPYAKQWARGSNPRSQLQSEQRADLVQFAQNWANLTLGQQNGWNTYAAAAAQEKTNSLGEAYYVSGFNWYVALSLNLKRAGLAAIDTAPVNAAPGAPSVNVANLRTTASGAETVVGTNPALPNATDRLVVYLRIFNSEGRRNVAAVDKWMTTELPNVSDQVRIQDEVEAAFGTIQTDQVGFFRVGIMSDEGRIGPFTTVRNLAS